MHMSWALKRRVLILSIVILVLAFVGGGVFFLLSKPPAPTCIDGIQNQDERGVDCGGMCAYLCASDVTVPSVTFTRAVTSGSRVDVVAQIQNRNSRASAENARYTVELYDQAGVRVGVVSGVIDIPPGATVPIFHSGIARDVATIGQAFLTIDSASLHWYESPLPASSPLTESVRTESLSPPSVTALLRNPTAYPMRDITVVATIFDALGVPFAASQTVVETLPPRGTAPVSFFWNESFLTTPGRIDVRAVPQLP